MMSPAYVRVVTRPWPQSLIPVRNPNIAALEFGAQKVTVNGSAQLPRASRRILTSRVEIASRSARIDQPSRNACVR